MTTTVKRGAGRPAAAAKTAKHAQRNPQTGPRPAVAVAQAIADEDRAKAHLPYGQMSLQGLRKAASGLGVKGASRLNKGDLLNAVLDAERAANAEQDLLPQDEDSPGGAYVPEPAAPAEAKGAAKAAKLAAALEPHGWDVLVAGDPQATDACTAVARRGGETLTVTWHAGVYSYEQSTHLVHDRTTRLRNVSAAIKLASRPREAVEAEYGKVISNRRFRPAATKAPEGHLQGVPVDRRLFDNPNEVSRDELWAALAGYRVVWVNRVSNMTESATVSQNAKFFQVRDNPAGERMVEFCTVGMGFRACRVSDIISTSRKPGKARRTKTLPGGEEVRAA
jgi:hypothetical protein